MSFQSVPDTSTTVKGIIKLGGDLAGTSSAPTIGTNKVLAGSNASTAAASTIDGTNAVGTATSLARSDHNHALPTLGPWFEHPMAGASVSSAVTFSNLEAYCQIKVLSVSTLTGIAYWVGSTASGNVKSALYNSSGTRVATCTATIAQATANTFQKVAFDSTYSAAPGVYFAAIIFSSSTATHLAGKSVSPDTGTLEGSFATASTLTVPTTATATSPVYTTY